MPLSHKLRKCTGGYKLHKSKEQINHLIYRNDIKLLEKIEKELETLIQTIIAYSQDIGMEFSIEKSAILMIMDDIKLCVKNEKELETLIYSDDIGMEFGIEKCTMLIMISGKRQMTERIELPNQGKIIMLWKKETYKYLEILETDTIKQAKVKEEI